MPRHERGARRSRSGIAPEKQERGEDERERKKCEKCLSAKGLELDAWEADEECKKDACRWYQEIPSLCEWVGENESGEEGFCRLKPMKSFDDIYEVHNDFISRAYNETTERRGDGSTNITLKNERCFYAGAADQCFQATTEQDAYGTAMRRRRTEGRRL